jgi:hypothetical protein
MKGIIMDIFESLKNLNVSEECFDDIMGIVEEILSEDIYDYIQKKHGKAVYDISTNRPANKSAKLIRKAQEIAREEEHQATMRDARVTEPDGNKWSSKDRNNLQNAHDKIKGKREETKNTKGKDKTEVRSSEAYWNGLSQGKVNKS